MKKYFSISEFARLRNININSLRYYEKIGILKPVYVDPQTKYRYYSPEQLSQLDMILLCIDLGIPLKELIEYVDQQGCLQSRELLREGKRVAQERMDKIQRSMGRIEHSLEYFETIADYERKNGQYHRCIKTRKILTSDYQSDLQNIGRVEAGFTDLFERALYAGLSPVLPSGILIDYHDGAVRYKQFFEVLGEETVDEKVMVIPEGNFLCQQIELNPGMDLEDILDKNFPSKEAEPIIISNMFPGKFQFKSLRTELQQRAF